MNQTNTRHAGLRAGIQAWIPAFAGMTIALSACGGGGLYTNADIAPQSSLSQSDDAGSAVVTTDAFLFASPYPARIIIPDIEGMRSTAFVVSTVNPSGVIAIDLDKTPYVLSQKFKGVNSPSGSGLPNNLVIQSTTRAFMLTSFAIVDFNPTTGVVNSTTMLPQSVKLPAPLAISRAFDYDNDGSDNTTITEIPLKSPGGIAIAGNTLWISTANYLRYPPPAAAAPGVVLRYTIGATGLAPASPGHLITSGFNPTGITAIGNTVLVTNSGVLDIVSGEAVPRSESSVDIFDATNGTLIANVPAGLAALSFTAPAVDAEGRFAYIGSSAFSEVFQLDIPQRTFTRGLSNPITLVSDADADYITGIALSPDNRRAYVGSFDTSSVVMLNLAASPVSAFSTPYVVGFPKGVTAENPTGVNTGVGDIAVRPGTAGVDFKGPDIFILTGNPGTLATITTQAQANTGTEIRSLSIAPTFLPIEVGTNATVTGDVTFNDGRQMVNIHTQFTHPTTGQYMTLQWSSDNPNIASVTSSGLVIGMNAGITTIRAHIGKYSAQLPVAVHLGKTPPPAPAENTPASGNFEPPPQKDPEENGKLIVVNCKDIGASPFVEQVVSYAVGNGGGFNQNKLPGVVTQGPQGGGTYAGGTDVFSLGANGTIIVAFNNCWVADGNGTDFIVFENAFYMNGTTTPFSEPAVVGVSMDGVNFTDFPCDLKQSPTYPGCAGTHPIQANSQNGIDPTDPAKAGGDPFDLAMINVKSAKFIRIIDQGLSPIYGANGTNGFDLDAIAIVHGAKPKP
jgi:hypothetical protein